MTVPYQPEPGCSAMQRQLGQQLADTRREVRALEGDLGQARERSAELQARVEQLQTGTSMREALLAEARDLLEPWGGHGDDWPSLVPPIEALIDKLDEALQRAEQAEARLAEQDNAITWGTSCLSCARVLDSCYAEHVRAEKAEAERDQFAAGVPLACSDDRHEAKVRGLEQALTSGQKAAEYWEGAYTREVAAHGRTGGALNRVRAQCERWRHTSDRKRAAEEMLAELDRDGDHFADSSKVIKADDACASCESPNVVYRNYLGTPLCCACAACCEVRP